MLKSIAFALVTLISVSAVSQEVEVAELENGRKTNNLGCHSLAEFGYPELELCSKARNIWERSGGRNYGNDVRLTMQVTYHGIALRGYRFRSTHVDTFKIKKGATKVIKQIIPGTCEGGYGTSFTTEYKRRNNNTLRIRQQAPTFEPC